MFGYRVFIFKDGHIQRGETIIAEDDAAAVTQGSVVASGSSFEVWQGSRLVVNSRPSAPDAASG